MNIHEECGVFGVIAPDTTDVASILLRRRCSRDLTTLPSSVYITEIVRQRLRGSSETDTFCLRRSNSFRLPLADGTSFIFRNKAEYLQYNIRDKGS